MAKTPEYTEERVREMLKAGKKVPVDVLRDFDMHRLISVPREETVSEEGRTKGKIM